MRLDPATLDRVRQAAADVRLALAGDEDEQAILDTVDGETDVMDLVGWLVKRRREAKAAAEANGALAADYRERASRHVAKGQAMSDGLLAVLDALGLTRVQHPVGTVSRLPAKRRLECDDTLPTQLRKPGEPDALAIRRLLDAGEDVPGARYVEGRPSVRVV